MPRLSLQRLLRCGLYIVCGLMLLHVLHMLRHRTVFSSSSSSSSSIGASDGDASQALASSSLLSDDDASALAVRRRVASLKAISPELLHRIGRPVPQPCFPAASASGSSACPQQQPQAAADSAEPAAAVLSEPLLLTRTPFNYTVEPLAAHYALDAASANETDLLAAMRQINSEQDVLNARLYTGPVSEVFVVQAHDRIEYLYLLIDSLRRVKDIQDCLIVFSHDVYSPAINALVRSIRFARVLQVFFPYNKQIYYNRFPGSDPRDCPRDATQRRARSLRCSNAEWPDSYGHYRESKYTQTKHHWLYKMHFVFERAAVLANYTGQVVFLEEDHYVVEDFLHVLRLMDTAKRQLYPDVEILTLATYEKKPDFTRDTARVVVDRWVSSFHNMGMAFTRQIWNRIRPCLRKFCEFDDYNWDWSLNHIANGCASPKRPFQTMVIRISPRVFHIGECGVHHKKKVCNPVLLTSKLDKMLADNIAHLYPERLSFNAKLKIRARSLKPNGGWGDLRDRQLCISFFDARQRAPAGLPSGL